MTGESPPRARGPLRAGGGLVVVDEAQNRADIATLMRSQALLQSGAQHEATLLLGGLAASPTTTVRAHAATILAALLIECDDAAAALAALDSIPAHGVVVDRAVIAMVRAQACRQLGRHVDAVAAAREAWAASPSTERALVLTAALVATGAPHEAVVVLRAALAACPGDAGLLGQLAGALALSNRHDEADAVAAELEAIAAVNDAGWHRQRAWAAACRGRLAEAQTALDAAVALDEPGTRHWCSDDPLLAARGLRLP